ARGGERKCLDRLRLAATPGGWAGASDGTAGKSLQVLADSARSANVEWCKLLRHVEADVGAVAAEIHGGQSVTESRQDCVASCMKTNWLLYALCITHDSVNETSILISEAEKKGACGNFQLMDAPSGRS